MPGHCEELNDEVISDRLNVDYIVNTSIHTLLQKYTKIATVL